MKKIFNILVASVLTLTVGTSVVSCNEDPIGLGGGLVGGDASGYVDSLDVIAYNSRFDSIRSDQRFLQNALLGAYEEPVFGRTQASFISQLRLTSLSPSFGENPSVDSVQLFIPVYYNSTSDSVRVDTLNLSKPGIKPEDSDTILIRKSYRVDSIYGNRNATMTLNVKDISTVLYTDKAYYSNNNLGEDQIAVNSTVLGSASVGGRVQNITIKQKSSSSNIYEEPIGYKINLDKNYFKEKIIDNEKTGMLDDYATFIRRVIQGFQFSVEENNGFLFAFNPNDIQMRMYYSNDGSTDDAERNSLSIAFNFYNLWNATSGSNVQVNHFINSNQGADFVRNYTSPNKTEGESKLYLNGADGTRVHVKLVQDQLNALRTKKEAEGLTFIGAKLEFHIDNAYNLPKPGFIMAWNNYKKEGKVVDELFADVLEFYNSYPNNVHFNPMIGSNNYYTIDITKHFKKMLEQNEEFEDQEMIVALGNFLMGTSDTSTIFSTSPFYRNTVANPYRVVLHGNNIQDEAKKLKLKVYYTKK